MLKSLELENFTAFGKARLQFAKGLNVFVGENGLGKTHLLKLPYAVVSVSAEEGRKPNAGEPTKGLLQPRVAQKLVNVFRPESLGRLIRRKPGRNRSEVRLESGRSARTVSFSFAAQSKSEVAIEVCPSEWIDKAPVFLPTQELLTIFPGFVSVYDNHYLEFEETWRDTCRLLGLPALKGAREKTAARLLQPLEETMGGKIVLDQNGRFYLKLSGTGNMGMPLVAEGLRKLAMLARLIATGSLLGQGYLFWDEPESSLNPKLIRKVAEAILHGCDQGIQVFLATHSLFLLREFEILLSRNQFKHLPQRYFALGKGADGVLVHQGDRVDEVDPLAMLDEELLQSDRFVAEDTES